MVILKNMDKAIIYCCCLAFMMGCAKRDQLILEKVNLKDQIKGDTIGRYLNDKLILLKTKEFGYLGEFRYQFIFIKKENSNSELAYKIVGNDDIRVYDNNIYVVDEKGRGFGWFYIENGQIAEKLPKIDSILLQIEKNSINRFVREDNGIISIFENGEVIDRLNYGNFLLDNSKFCFEDLKFGLYELINDRLIKISNDGRELLKQDNGLYYVPYPEYNMKKVYKFREILLAINSKNGEKMPDGIFIK